MLELFRFCISLVFASQKDLTAILFLLDDICRAKIIIGFA